jgi:hypothetical protein
VICGDAYLGQKHVGEQAQYDRQTHPHQLGIYKASHSD